MRYFRPVRRLVLAAAAVSAALFVLPVQSAQATSIYTQVLRAYEANGSVPPCQFTSQQLETALKGINTYGAQYFADFTAAVQTALSARASGACLPQSKVGGGGAPVGGPDTGVTLGPLTAATDAGIPLPILAMAVLGALLGVLGIIALTTRGRRPRPHPRKPGDGPPHRWTELGHWAK